MDYYTVLGVDPSAEDIVIRAAYKALAQRYHPDRFAGSKDEAHRRMSELTIAYEVLADPLLRPKYDRRRFASTYTRAVTARFNGSRKYASRAIDPGEPRWGGAMWGRYRIALAALLGVVVVLSAFNLVHHAGRIKEWLGTNTAGTSSLPISQGSVNVVDTASAKAQPPAPLEPSATPAAALAVPSMPEVKEKRRSSARSAAADRPAKSEPVAVATEPCRDVVAALGLCSSERPAKSK